MKFGKEFTSQMVHEWQEAYMDYNYLKGLLKDILNFRKKIAPIPEVAATPNGSLKRRLSMYRAFSGLQRRFSFKGSPGRNDNEDEEVILVSSPQQEGSQGHHQTMFLMSSEKGGEYEMVFFRRLDDEFNKVLTFYEQKVGEVKAEADELSKQMDALIALRIMVDKPSIGMDSAQVMVDPTTSNDSTLSPASVVPTHMRSPSRPHMEAIQEVELTGEELLEEESTSRNRDKTKKKLSHFRPAPIEILDNVKINIDPATPISTLKNVIKTSKPNSSFSKNELSKAEEQMTKAFVVFYQKLRLLKNYRFLNVLAFSKILKKYDKATSRKASKSYSDMVDKSDLGSSDEVNMLIERVEVTFVKHFANGNRRKGMRSLRPQAKRERHRVTFFLGLFSGCSIALVAAIAVAIRAGNLLEHKDRGKYMDNIFPLYSLFGYIVLHMLMYGANVYYWRRFRVNYPFIFGFKQGTELGYRQVFLLASGLSVLALAATLFHLDMDMNPITKSYETVKELIPLMLVFVLLLITFCPLNILYRSSRFFFLRTAWHCLCAPLYKVTLPDFLLADQLTSQVQAIRNLQFYVCYYVWGNFKTRSNTCQESSVYQILHIMVAIIPFWSRFLQV
ncbi:unnamed protein product [Withania somnifera]